MQKKPTVYRILYYALPILFAFWWLPFSLFSSHSQHEDSSKMFIHLLEHVQDTYAFHFGSVVLYLPIILYQQGSGWHIFSSSRILHLNHGDHYQGFFIKAGKIVHQTNKAFIYDLSITKNVVWMWLIVFPMLLVFIGCARYLQKKGNQPVKGFWIVPLYIIRFLRDNVAREYIGPKHYKRFMSYLLTIFFYILCNNLLGLLPEGPNITGNLSAAMGLGFLVLFITCIQANIHYWKHIFMPPDTPLFMYPIMIPLEVLAFFLRPFILSMRLFANVLAGHLTIICIIGLIFILKTIFASFIAIPLCAAISMLEILVSFIQAYVFTIFSAMSFGKAVEEKH